MKKLPDPYRELGVPRGANAVQIKAAHRRLAKRFHPDAADGDTDRFLAVQEAYSLLSDPLRRREWDARHAPGPVRAGEPGVRSRPRTRGSDGRWTRSEGADPPGARGGRAGPPRDGAGHGSGAAQAARERAPGGRSRARSSSLPDEGGDDRSAPAETAWSASERDPSTRTYTWSAENVPWWQDFTPRDRDGWPGAAADDGVATEPGRSKEPGRSHEPARSREPARTHEPARTNEPGRANEMDVYNRSSGAAWSMAARRYFRRGDAELPRGGAFRYRGTQVVTGAEARRVAAEESQRAAADERRAAAEDLLRARPRAPAAPPDSVDHGPAMPPPAAAPTPAPVATAQPKRPAPSPMGPVPGSPAAPAAAARLDMLPASTLGAPLPSPAPSSSDEDDPRGQVAPSLASTEAAVPGTMGRDSATVPTDPGSLMGRVHRLLGRR